MDKNTFTGFLLIAIVMIAFMLTQRPNEEQLRERKRIQDSIQQVKSERAKQQAKQLLKSETTDVAESNVLDDFFGGETSISEEIGRASCRERV